MGDRWVDVLARARSEERVSADFSRASRESTVTDVDPMVLLVAGITSMKLEFVFARREAGEDEVGRTAFRMLEHAWSLEARVGRFVVGGAPVLSAAVLWPGVFDRARTELTQEYRNPQWAMFARIAVEPAASRFAELELLSAPDRQTA